MSGSSGDFDKVFGSVYADSITTTSITNSGASSVTGAQTIGGNLSVTGNLAVTGTQLHTGALTQTAAASFGSTVTTTGLTTANGGLTVLGGATVSGGSTLNGVTIVTTALRTTASVGTAGTNCTVVEQGDGNLHKSVVTVSAAVLTSIASANKGIGALIYTFPAGVIIVRAVQMNISAGTGLGTAASVAGVGTVIASGAVAVLNGTATFMDYVTEQSIANSGTFVARKTTIPTSGTSKVLESGDSHAVNLNAAGAWNATTASPTVTAVVTIHWEFSSA